MASQDSKGSIIFKILIVLLVLAMIIVIILPGKIWDEEAMDQETSQGNMATLYDSHKYFYNLKSYYASSDEELISTVQNDSALIKRQIIVNHTTRIKEAMEAFLNNPPVNNLHDIYSNLKNIEDDLNANKRFFRTIEQIDQEAEEIKLQLATFRSGVEFEKYHLVILDLDSLWRLRRDLTDYSLQSAARLASSFSRDVANDLPNIDFTAMYQLWSPLTNRISDLMNEVNSTKLKSLTSIADRVADFQRDADDGFSFFLNNNSGTSFNGVTAASEDLIAVYREFLSDFLITEEYSQYILTESDSLLINISENSFYTPRDHQRYIVTLDDSIYLRVEDPTLLEELKSKAEAEASQLVQLPFMEAFANYQQQLDAIRDYFPQIKAKYRRNIDITIKTKEVEATLDEIPSSAAFDAYLKSKSFTEKIPVTDSYSEIKDQVESTLLSTGAFRQIYGDNFFGNLDTLHIEIIAHLNEYNEILSKIRRNQFSFDTYIDNLNTALTQIKAVPKESVLPVLEQVEENLKNIYLFASEGKEQSVYGLFSTRIVNFGKISGPIGQKSWEE